MLAGILCSLGLGVCGAALGSGVAVMTDANDTDYEVRINKKNAERGLWMGFLAGALVGAGGYYFLTKPPPKCCDLENGCAEVVPEGVVEDLPEAAVEA